MNDNLVLNLRHGVELDRLQEVLRELVDLQGCPACGLNGWDLTIKIDPEIAFATFAEKFADQVTRVDVVPAANVGLRR